MQAKPGQLLSVQLLILPVRHFKVKFDVIVTLVTFGAQTSYTINSLCFGGFLNERLIFFFCKGPLIYANQQFHCIKCRDFPRNSK